MPTAASASFRAVAEMASRISIGSNASWAQYSRTTSGRAAHSSSIRLASTSILRRSSRSGNNSSETNLSVSRLGRNVIRASHQASITHRPFRTHLRFCWRLGRICGGFLPLDLQAASVTGTRAQPASIALVIRSLESSNSSIRSLILGKSKLSILYPVMISGSLSRTRRVRPSSISRSSPLKVCVSLSPFCSTTAAAHRILPVSILVSKSNEKVTNGAANASIARKSSM